MVFIELYRRTERLLTNNKNASQINFIENILGVCKKYEGSEKEGEH